MSLCEGPEDRIDETLGLRHLATRHGGHALERLGVEERVRITPGQTVSTCTPASSTSRESARARPTTANFEAAYTDSSGAAILPATDATLVELRLAPSHERHARSLPCEPER